MNKILSITAIWPSEVPVGDVFLDSISKGGIVSVSDVAISRVAVGLVVLMPTCANEKIGSSMNTILIFFMTKFLSVI